MKIRGVKKVSEFEISFWKSFHATTFLAVFLGELEASSSYHDSFPSIYLLAGNDLQFNPNIQERLLPIH